jgi:hypothetical protein
MTQPKLLKAIREGLELARALYFPLSEKEKKDYMLRVEDRKDFYQPKIEAKTGVPLGKVYVLPMDLILANQIYEVLWKLKHTNELKDYENLKERSLLGKLEEAYINTAVPLVAMPIVGLFGAIMYGLFKIQDQAIYGGMVEDCLRVSYGIETRMGLFREKRFNTTSFVDGMVVHELSHKLWDVIEGEKQKTRKFNRCLNEGFATYCHEEYFRDLYPTKEMANAINVPELYLRGKNKIKKIVAKYGQEILLEIPNRWPELI